MASYGGLYVFQMSIKDVAFGVLPGDIWISLVASEGITSKVKVKTPVFQNLQKNGKIPINKSVNRKQVNMYIVKFCTLKAFE